MLSDFSPRLGGYIGMAEKRRRLLRFHWLEMEIMEILSSWSETMVYIPVRAGVGRQMWEQAVNCDRIAWALRNLKSLGRVVTSTAPSDELVRFCEQLHATKDVAGRLVGLHRVLIPALAAAERAYIAVTDPLADANSIDALETCLRHHADQERWCGEMLAMLASTPAAARAVEEQAHALRIALIDAGGVDAAGAEAYFLPYGGWPDGEPAAMLASIEADGATRGRSPGQWRSTGYRYRKGFATGLTMLPWDERFRYAASPAELEAATPPHGTLDGLVYWLHGLFHGECQTVDRMGWLLVDFPDLPWPMRFDLAQQAWEEARHIQITAQILEGLGGRLGQYPFIPYFGRLRRDYHHPVMHMVMGNIMGEGSAAAQTNDALKYSAGWGNDWLRRGLEHLSGDEVVHITFGKKWGRALSKSDPERYWQGGRASAQLAVDAIEQARVAFGYPARSEDQPEPARIQFGYLPRADDQLERIGREFAALLGQGADDEASESEAVAGAY